MTRVPVPSLNPLPHSELRDVKGWSVFLCGNVSDRLSHLSTVLWLLNLQWYIRRYNVGNCKQVFLESVWTPYITDALWKPWTKKVNTDLLQMICGAHLATDTQGIGCPCGARGLHVLDRALLTSPITLSSLETSAHRPPLHTDVSSRYLKEEAHPRGGQLTDRSGRKMPASEEPQLLV